MEIGHYKFYRIGHRLGSGWLTLKHYQLSHHPQAFPWSQPQSTSPCISVMLDCSTDLHDSLMHTYRYGYEHHYYGERVVDELMFAHRLTLVCRVKVEIVTTGIHAYPLRINVITMVLYHVFYFYFIIEYLPICSHQSR